MSWYYSYYIGKKVNNKIEIIGMYDNKGEVHPVLERGRMSASSLYENFVKYYGEDLEDLQHKLGGYISILPYRDLPSGDYIKRGYFLIEDVNKYLEEHNSWDLFYDKISPEVYVERFKNEQVFGAPRPKKDSFDCEYEPHSCADYIYFTYPDEFSEEYEASMIRYAVSILDPNYDEMDDIVVVLSQG